jgi:hypothetical protein
MRGAWQLIRHEKATLRDEVPETKPAAMRAAGKGNVRD